MIKNCIKCKNKFDEYNEKLCKGCYELQIFKGQCLNVAAILLQTEINPHHSESATKLFDLTKKIYDEGKNGGFLKW